MAAGGDRARKRGFYAPINRRIRAALSVGSSQGRSQRLLVHSERSGLSLLPPAIVHAQEIRMLWSRW